MADYPDFEGPKSGIYLQPHWAERIGEGKKVVVFSGVLTGTWSRLCSYLVVAGKRLNVTSWGCYSEIAGGIVARLGESDTAVRHVGGGYGGFWASFSQPEVFEAGEYCEIWVYHVLAAVVNCSASFGGYLEDV